jgi:hypothetical protein
MRVFTYETDINHRPVIRSAQTAGFRDDSEGGVSGRMSGYSISG